MGCDIHPYIEIRQDGEWHLFDGVLAEDAHRDSRAAEKGYKIVVDYLAEFIGGRDYGLFAMLADVRTHSGDYVHDEPRGCPKDMSPKLQQIRDDDGDDGHSDSYYTLEELLFEIPWDKKIVAYDDIATKPSTVTFEQRFSNLYTLAQILGGICQTLHITTEDCRIVFWFDN